MDKISIKDLNLFYGEFQALKSINMQIPEKEIEYGTERADFDN